MNRLESTSTETVFWVLIAIALGLLSWRLTSHNPMAFQFLLWALVVFIVIRVFDRGFLPRVTLFGKSVTKTHIASLATVVAAIQCVAIDLPLTSVGLTVRQPQTSVEVVVAPLDAIDRTETYSNWISSKRKLNRISYLLSKPIQNTQSTLEFIFGVSGQSFTLVNTSYGTDFFKIPYALVILEGKQFQNAVRIHTGDNRLEQTATGYDLSSKIRSKPAFRLPAVEEYIRHLIDERREFFARLIWFVIHLTVILLVWNMTPLNRLLHNWAGNRNSKVLT